jgi:hypothetical protein
MKVYEDYVVVMPASQAMMVTNLLANLGLALEGLVLEIPEGDDYLVRIEPKNIHEAYKAVRTALEENWLGHNGSEL